MAYIYGKCMAYMYGKCMTYMYGKCMAYIYGIYVVGLSAAVLTLTQARR